MVSVVILNYNGWRDTVECLESVLRSDYEDYELIVVDNGSNDSSMEHLKAWAEGREAFEADGSSPISALSSSVQRKPLEYVCCSREQAETGDSVEQGKGDTDALGARQRRLVFIETGENLGFAGGNNVAIRYALKSACSYILLLNNDTVVEPDLLSELTATASHSENVGIVGAGIAYYDRPDEIWSCGGRIDLLRGSGYHCRVCPCEEDFDVTFVTGCAMLISRKVIETVGLLPVQYFLTVEDLDYCYSCRQAGYTLRVNPRSRVYHKVSAAMCAGDSSAEVYYNTRNRLHFMLRRVRKLRYVTCFMVFFPVSRMLKAFVFATGRRWGHLAALWRGLVDGFRPRGGGPGGAV